MAADFTERSNILPKHVGWRMEDECRPLIRPEQGMMGVKYRSSPALYGIEKPPRVIYSWRRVGSLLTNWTKRMYIIELCSYFYG